MAQASAIMDPGDIRPGLNESGSTIAARRLVKKVAGSAEDSVELGAANTDPIFGVTMADILDDERGDVQVGGMAIVTAGVAIARGDEITSGATGKAEVAGAGDYVAGVARSAATGVDESFEVELVGPNSGRIL